MDIVLTNLGQCDLLGEVKLFSGLDYLGGRLWINEVICFKYLTYTLYTLL